MDKRREEIIKKLKNIKGLLFNGDIEETSIEELETLLKAIESSDAYIRSITIEDE